MSDQGSLPVLSTQNGSIFDDRDDQNVFWYLPVLQPADPTSAFSFAATVGPQVDSAGNPFDSAMVSIPLTVVDPPDVVAARQANPASTYQVIPAASYDVTLAVPYLDGEGDAQTSSVSGTITMPGDGTLLAVFPALLGPTVVQEYVALTTGGNSTLVVGYSFEGWAHIVRLLLLNPVAPAPAPAGRAGLPAEPALLPTLPVRRPIPVLPPIQIRPPILFPPIPPELWVTVTTRQAVTVDLGMTYAQQPYLPLYTLTQPPATIARPIANVSDLTTFTSTGTEYVQLSSLGDVPARYPSLTSVYLGRVSGTVVAVPAAYGIVHTSSGCEMSISAVVDTDSVSGSQFQVSLTLGPIIDPCDLAQLSADVQGIPEARNLRLTVTPPAGLAAAPPPTFSLSETVTNLVVADGQVPGTVDVSFVIADFQSDGTVIPAWVTINELILQLTSNLIPPPLLGSLGLKLDDAYPEPPQASFFLALTTTASSEDTTVTIGPAGSSPTPVTVTNQSPNDLLLLRLGLTTAAGQADQDLAQQVLPAGQATSISASQPEPSAAVVSTTLSVPSPFPRGALQSYVIVTAESVQQIEHQLTVNATAVDFAALGIASVTVQIALTALPAVVVPLLTLDPTSNVASATVTIPIGAALIGLSASLAIAVGMPDGSSGGADSLTTDFMTSPIFVLTPGDLPGAS
ncbi:MAG: hypothetical protein ACLPKI_09180 [Streptosporangiaceae bacterium]